MITIVEYRRNWFYIYEDNFLIGELERLGDSRVRVVDLRVQAKDALGKVLSSSRITREYFDHADTPSVDKVEAVIEKAAYRLMVGVFHLQQLRMADRRDLLMYWKTEDEDEAWDKEHAAGQVEVISICDYIDSLPDFPKDANIYREPWGTNFVACLMKDNHHYYGAPREQYSEAEACRQAVKAGKTSVVVEDLS